MCECYQIGGPFIAEDPECPVHGREAQSRAGERRAAASRLRDVLQSYPLDADSREAISDAIDLLQE